MKKGRLYDADEIEYLAKSAIGKTFRELKDSELISFTEKELNKGDLGQLVEKALYGIETNSESEPDFMPAGVELKVTPYKKNKGKSLSAKERLVLNIINYNTEYANDFKSSHFWFKNRRLQLLWYLHEANKEKLDFKITNELFLSLDFSDDLYQIEKDWYTIVNKIREGRAHELSEADTMYLGACTKGNGTSMRTQPFSSEKAKQRAFCFKQSYMTQLVRKYIGDYEDVEKIVKDRNLTFEDYIKSTLSKYQNKSVSELVKTFEVDSKKAKNLNFMLVSRMFGVKGNLTETEEFKKANIVPKTITINSDKSIRESMSFPAFKFSEIINEDWDTCELKEMFETTKYLFCIFKIENNEKIFKGIKLWNMPGNIISNDVRRCWEETVYRIKNGVKLTIDSKGLVSNNLPGSRDNLYVHVRPHTNKSAYKLQNGFEKGNVKADADLLPQGDYMTKQSFWINNSYLKEIVSEYME